MLQEKNKKNGFTLFELLLVISLIVIIFSVTISVGRTFSSNVDLENTVKGISSKIKLAKSQSISALDGTHYSVRVKPSKIVIFKGSTFTEGLSTNSEYIFSDNIKISSHSLGGGDDIVFSRLTGLTNNSGTITVQVINDPSNERQIFINSDGQISLDAFQTSVDSPIQNARHVHFALGWKIETSTQLTLKWVDATEVQIAITDIEIASYFDSANDVFDWTGTTLVDGVNQEIRIHSWLDGNGHTVLCVKREQTETKKLYIFTDSGAKDIAIYENNSGVISVQADFFGGTMSIQ